MTTHISPQDSAARRSSILEIFLVFLRLGLTSFGGPIAHLGYFHKECVVNRKWLDERSYADLVALCQFLPGPASSQIGIAIGLSRAGYGGAFAAWAGFTFPSAIALVLFSFGLSALGNVADNAWLHGLTIMSVAVVAQAVLSMMRALTPDKERLALAIASAFFVFAFPSVVGQIGVIVLGGIFGFFFLRKTDTPHDASAMHVPVGKGTAFAALLIFFALLVGLPILAMKTEFGLLALLDIFYRAGALVFGGGHVVLPLLQAEVVPQGLLSNDQFLAGYGAAQAVPGPLFSFAAYLGAAIGGPGTALLCLVAIYIPSFLLVIGTLPFWEKLRRKTTALAIQRGVNAAVVGLLLAAFYNPVYTTGIKGIADIVVALAAFILLQLVKMPPLAVLLACMMATGGLSLLPI